MSTLDETVAIVAGKVDRMRGLKAGRIQPPIPEAELALREKKMGVRLPEELRRFFLEIANGCDAAQVHLLSIDGMLDESRKTIWTFADPFEPPLSSAERVTRDAPGMLMTNGGGCSFFDAIVVSGPERGNMWSYSDSQPCWLPIVPSLEDLREPDGTRRGRGIQTYAGDTEYAHLWDSQLLPQNRDQRLGFFAWYQRRIDPWLASKDKAS